MSKTVDFFFTVISSYSYLSMPRLREIQQRTDVSIVYRPVDIMKVFEAAGTTPPVKQPDARKSYRLADLVRVAKAQDLPITTKPAFWPAPQNLASGLIIAAQEAGYDPWPLTKAILSAVWAEDKNIADQATLEAIATACGAEKFLEQAMSDEAQTAFAANTTAAQSAGVFGAPTFVLDGELFWGHDRLDYLEAAL